MTSHISKPLPGSLINPLHPISRGIKGLWLFNEGAGTTANDISGNRNHGSLANMASNSQGTGWAGTKFGGGLAFDDINDYVDCGNDKSLDISTSGSISALIYPTNVINFCTIVGKMGADDLHSSIYFYVAGGNVYLRVYDVAGGWITVVTPIVADVWQHVVGTYDGEYLRIYLDGELKHTDDPTPTINTTASPLHIGGNTRWASELFEGTIDHVIYWTRDISAFDVKQLYHDPYCIIN